jgi:exoribonuclease II
VRLFSLFVTGAMFVAAVSLASALFTDTGVGVFEYVVGFALVVALLAAAVVRSRSLLRNH